MDALAWTLAALVVVGALVVLALLARRLWRTVRTLGRDVAGAAERMGELQAALDRADGSAHLL